MCASNTNHMHVFVPSKVVYILMILHIAISPEAILCPIAIIIIMKFFFLFFFFFYQKIIIVSYFIHSYILNLMCCFFIIGQVKRAH